MARYTAAYSAFSKRLVEVEALHRLAAEKERKDPIHFRDQINALIRSSIVLLTSHVEAYIKELGELALDSLYTKSVPRDRLALSVYYHISKDILKSLKDTKKPEKIAEKVFSLLEQDGDFWVRTGAFPRHIEADRFNWGFANPSIEKTKNYFGRFGYDRYERDLKALMAGEYKLVMNAVNHVIEMRHQIAHGDLIVPYTPSDLLSNIGQTKKFCRYTDQSFATWWRAEYCSIR
ncbi:MAG: MAE_28990/MAE_18760 family HEPN-like nuclease [Chloroflexota bacterium]|nr:MAE_28990/MAE_18760 family HEPN-like nuclease [Chloroflexota bacterium]